VRVGYSTYELRIAWTPLGAALRGVRAALRERALLRVG